MGLVGALVTILGFVVTLVTAFLLARCWVVNNPLMRAFAYKLVAEIVASIVFIVFSVTTWLDAWEYMPPLLAESLRAIALIIILASSIHLANVIRKIELG